MSGHSHRENEKSSFGRPLASDVVQSGRKKGSRMKETRARGSSFTFERLEERDVPAVFTVSSTLDDGSVGTLRWAIEQANATAGLDTIQFQLASTATKISLQSALPTITDAIHLHGFSQPGSNVNTSSIGGSIDAAPRVILDGSGAGAGVSGLHITAGNSTVRGLVIQNFSGYGIHLENGGGNTIGGNFIGTDVTGLARAGNGGGILIAGSSNNQIGGASAASRNLVSGNHGVGIHVVGIFGGAAGNTLIQAAAGNKIEGNYIGVSKTGSNALGNTLDGVRIERASGNFVGNKNAGTENIIAGNGQDGVAILGAESTYNRIAGNFIGTNTQLAGGVGNGGAGVRVVNGTLNLIGEIGTFGRPNTIAYNRLSGVILVGGARNAVTRDLIFANDLVDGAPLGIELLQNANLGMPAPVIENAVYQAATASSSATLEVTYRLPAGVSKGTFHVEFYLDDGNGQGRTLLAIDSYAAVPGTSITRSFEPPAGITLSAGQKIVATMTDANFNSSAFSAATAISIPAPTPPSPPAPTPAPTPNSAVLRIDGSTVMNVNGANLTHAREIVIEGNGMLVITNARILQTRSVTLKDNAKLILVNSTFEHLAGGSASNPNWLSIQGNASIVLDANSRWIEYNTTVLADDARLVLLNGSVFDHRASAEPQVNSQHPTLSKFGLGLFGAAAISVEGGSHFIERNTVSLNDFSSLTVVGNSIIEHRQEVSFQNWLYANDRARVILRDSEVRSDIWLNWEFRAGGSLELTNVVQSQSGIWHSFQMDTTTFSTLNVEGSRFRGTLAGKVRADINNAFDTFIEYVFPDGAKVDESLPTGRIDGYTFPNSTATGVLGGLGGVDTGVGFNVSINDTIAVAWGITVRSASTVIISNSGGLTVTLGITTPYNGVVADLSNLGPNHYADQTWKLDAPGTALDTTLRLVNVTTKPWSPVVSDYTNDGINNRLILRDSYLADNAFSFGYATVAYYNSSASFIQANQFVQFTLNDTEVRGDLKATGNSKITVNDTEGVGKDARVGGKVWATDFATIILRSTDIGDPAVPPGGRDTVRATGNSVIHVYDSVIFGDVVAEGNAVIYLHNTTVLAGNLIGNVVVNA